MEERRARAPWRRQCGVCDRFRCRRRRGARRFRDLGSGAWEPPESIAGLHLRAAVARWRAQQLLTGVVVWPCWCGVPLIPLPAPMAPPRRRPSQVAPPPIPLSLSCLPACAVAPPPSRVAALGAPALSDVCFRHDSLERLLSSRAGAARVDGPIPVQLRPCHPVARIVAIPRSRKRRVEG